MAKKVPHKIDGGSAGADFWIGLPDTYQNVGTHLGVTKMSGGETGLKERKLKEAVMSGLVRRIHVAYTVGTGASAKRRVAKLIVAGDKADTAPGDVLQSGVKIQRGSTQYDIASVYYPTRRKLS